MYVSVRLQLTQAGDIQYNGQAVKILSDRLVPLRGGPVKHRPSMTVLRLDVGPFLQQKLDDRLVPIRGRPAQGRPSMIRYESQDDDHYDLAIKTIRVKLTPIIEDKNGERGMC